MALPVFSNRILCIALDLLQLAVGTASGAGVAAVGGDPVFVGGVAVAQKEVLSQTDVDVIPGEKLVLTEAPGGVELRVNAAFLKGLDQRL